ncbi:MAG: benzoate-CoA ligase family protein [Actinomycetota bacterium]
MTNQFHDHFNAAVWLVDRHVDEGRGDRTAVICQDRTLTYTQVQAEVHRAAAAFRALGVRPEERVAMAVLDSVEFVAAFLGAMRIGAVPLAMNPLLPGRDLAVIAADARARVAVVSGPMAGKVEELRAGAPELRTVLVTDTEAWDQFLAAGDGGDPAAYDTWAESPGFWLCTSGSTGRPKLAAHRHGDIRVTCETYARSVLGAGPEDRFYSVGPMFHAYGLGNSLSFPFAVGATAILEPTRPPTPALVAELVTRHRPTLFFCIPTFYAALLAADLPADTFDSVRYGVSAAESLPAETFERFQERHRLTILDGIGSTELLHIYLSNAPGAIKAGTSGIPVEGYEVRIVDDEGNIQPPGEPGQLLVRGDSVTTGYWCRTETNRATFDGAWMRTGDLYDRDGEGFYTYLGRVDDMLRVGGEWVSPAEVEGVLIEHPEVLEAAVVGERDPDGVLRPVAHVIPIGSEGGSESGSEGGPVDGGGTDGAALIEAMTELCRDRLAGYKRPKRYELVTELPKTATGKIQRFKLRAE